MDILRSSKLACCCFANKTDSVRDKLCVEMEVLHMGLLKIYLWVP